MNRYKRLRTQHGWTQAEAAVQCGTNRHTWQQWETNIVQPSASHLCHIADVFKVSVDYVLGRTNIARPPAVIRCADCEEVRDYEMMQTGARPRDVEPLCEDCIQQRWERQEQRKLEG